jgi:ABC-2 type transport system permease protein
LNSLSASVWAETLKVRKSLIFPVTIVLFSFVAVMMGILVFISRHPDIAGRSAIIGAKASLVGNGDWPSYWSLLSQVMLSLGAIGFGFVSSWVFGREYSDRTVKDLLALPVSRFTIVISKFTVIAVWCSVLTIVLFVVGYITGTIVQIPQWSTMAAFNGFSIIITGSFLTMLLCAPVAFIASVGRGYLLPLGYAILTLIMTNTVVVGIPGLAPYFPWAFPALCSGVTGNSVPKVGILSVIVYTVTVLSGLAGTLFWWKNADQT